MVTYFKFLNINPVKQKQKLSVEWASTYSCVGFRIQRIAASHNSRDEEVNLMCFGRL